MKSIGLDAVDINRFSNFENYNTKQLKKIFTESEIKYCLSNKAKSAERFAARFAAKEACYKSLYQILDQQLSFAQLAKYIEIDISQEYPQLRIIISEILTSSTITNISNYKFKLTITHSKNLAIALVIIL